MKPAKALKATSTILSRIAAMGAHPIQRSERHYTFMKEDLDREVQVGAPSPTDSSAGVINPYTDEITSAELSAEVEIVYNQFLQDFQYPINRHGQPLDLRFLGPHIAWHLVRCGWRPIYNRRMIKKVPIGSGPQRLDDAVTWVDVQTPDEMDPAAMTVDQLRVAPPHVQAEAIRKLNGDPAPPADGRNPHLGKPGYETWHQPWTLDTSGDPHFQDLMTRHAKAKGRKP